MMCVARSWMPRASGWRATVVGILLLAAVTGCTGPRAGPVTAAHPRAAAAPSAAGAASAATALDPPRDTAPTHVTATSDGVPASSPDLNAPDGPHEQADIAFAGQVLRRHRDAGRILGLTAGHNPPRKVADLIRRWMAQQDAEAIEAASWLAAWRPALTAEQVIVGTPGRVSPAQLSALGNSPADKFWARFLGLMTSQTAAIASAAATEMAEGANPAALTMAESILATDRSQLGQVRELLQ